MARSVVNLVVIGLLTLGAIVLVDVVVTARVGLPSARQAVLGLITVLAAGLVLSLMTIRFTRPTAGLGPRGLAGLFRLLGWIGVFVQTVSLAGLVVNFRSHVAMLEETYRYEGDEVIAIDDDSVLLYGEIGPRTVDSFAAAAVGATSVLELDSGGGRLDSARQIAAIVADRGLVVTVYGTCASACVLIALRGKELRAAPDAQFGFHRGSAIADAESELGRFASAQATEEMFDELRRRGIPNEILTSGRNTLPDDMHFETGRRLFELGIVDALVEE